MNEAKALRHVELLAREVDAMIKGGVQCGHCGMPVYDEDTGPSDEQRLLRDLRLALVELDLARSENAPSIYEDGELPAVDPNWIESPL